MQEDSYAFKRTSEVYHYEFYSEGPKGVIRKVVQFHLIDETNYVFNLAFGDWDDEREELNDKIATNNNDRQKVLATVAKTVLDFINAHPKATVVAKGSTASRTRLYQMGIAAFWDEINGLFYIDGYINGHWESFRSKRNYEAFLLERK